MEETKVEQSPKKEKTSTNSGENEVISMRQLLECGVHFGHQTKRWNPKMKRYIYTSRNNIHVIDLQQSIKLIKKAYDIAKDIAKNNGSILFVGTKKQAQDAIQEEAEKCGMPFVNHRWLGGTLTNHATLLKSINKLKMLEKQKEEGFFDQLSSKEASQKQKMLTRLTYYLGGIKKMVRMPSALFVVDTQKETLAIKEANRLGIPIIGIVDTNADPTVIQYPIPANDDAIRAVKLLCSVFSQAVLDGSNKQGEEAQATTSPAKEASASEVPEKKVARTKEA